MMAPVNSLSIFHQVDQHLNSAFYYNKGSNLLCILSVYFLFIILVLSSPASAQNHDDGVICNQDCSWEYYDKPTEQWTRKTCTLGNTEDNLESAAECPVYKTTHGSSSFPAKVENFSLTFYSKAKGNGKTTLCANVTFTLGREGIDLVTGIRFAIRGKTYQALNKNFCQYWKFESNLTPCAVSQGMCSVNDVERTFFYDCFCGLFPGYGTSPGGYLAAVDTLPKARGLVQEMKFFQVPACAELDENEYCGLSAKEMWHPLHLRLEQICDQPSLTITFDLPPVEIDVDKFTVYLYQEDQEELGCSYSNEVGKIKYRFTEITDTYEECFFNQTFNLTFFNQSEGLNYNASYMIITKIQDRDRDRNYYPTPICSPTVLIKPPPCDSNPCDINEICIPDCLNFTCQVIVDEEYVGTEELQYNSNLIWITSGVSGLVLVIIFILVLVFRCNVIKAGSNHKTDCNTISTVRLICNSNTHLQEFAVKLSCNLENLVGCPVEVITLTDPSDLSWESDAFNAGKNCFIMDNGLSILHFKEPNNGEITNDIVRTAVEKLPEASVDSTILIQFDFGDMFNPCYQQYTTYKLPSEWKQFVKELNPAADLTLVGDEDALLPSYQSIRNVLQENLCYKSVKKWMLSSEYDREESVASVCNFSTVTSLDEEEVNGAVTSYHTVI